MSLFVLASKDGWVDIMYSGLDAVGVDKQVKMDTQCPRYLRNICKASDLPKAS